MRLPAETNRSPVVPIGEPAQGGPRRKVQTEDLAVNVQGNGTNSALSFVVRTPSTRLITLVSVTFRPAVAEDIDTAFFPVGWFLKLDAWIRASQEKGGFLMRANNIVTNQTLPWSLNEPAQGIDEIRGVVTAPNPTQLPVGILYVTATWEPAPGESSIPDEELRKLFGVCTVLVNGGTVFIGGE